MTIQEISKDSYFKKNTNDKEFLENYIKTLRGISSEDIFSLDYDNDKNLALVVNEINWCLFMKNNSIQILPDSKLKREKIAHIAAHLPIYDIHTFLKAKNTDNKNYYVSVIYTKMNGYKDGIQKMLEHSLSFVKNIK